MIYICCSGIERGDNLLLPATVSLHLSRSQNGEKNARRGGMIMTAVPPLRAAMKGDGGERRKRRSGRKSPRRSRDQIDLMAFISRWI